MSTTDEQRAIDGLMLQNTVAEFVSYGFSDEEIARELSSVSKADLIGAIRVCAEEFADGGDEDKSRPVSNYCDHCGDPVFERNRHVVESLDKPVMTANPGESAVLCPECAESLNCK